MEGVQRAPLPQKELVNYTAAGTKTTQTLALGVETGGQTQNSSTFGGLSNLESEMLVVKTCVIQSSYEFRKNYIKHKISLFVRKYI